MTMNIITIHTEGHSFLSKARVQIRREEVESIVQEQDCRVQDNQPGPPGQLKPHIGLRRVVNPLCVLGMENKSEERVGIMAGQPSPSLSIPLSPFA